MPTPPGDTSPEQQNATDILRRMNPDEVHALLATWQADRLGGFGLAPRTVVELPDPPAEPSLLRVRVDLDGSRPAIWRRLELRGDQSVEQLHEVLQAAMGWADAHLHRFWLGPKKQIWTGSYLIADADLDEGEEGVHERDVQVGQVLRGVGDRLFYTYDFGDDWTHTIKVEAVEPLAADAPSAVCTGGRRACPPENVGGVHSYNDLVAAWRETPDDPLVDPAYAESLPQEWDATEFSAAEATQAIELAGVGIEEILTLASVTPAMHPGLDDLLSRADPDTRRELARLLGWVGEHTAYEDDGPGLDAHTLARAVLPWQLLLEIAGTEGIPLTGAGWMRPAVVQEVYDELGMGSEWVGKGNREDQTLPVLLLRESAQRVGLLRKSKDRLLATPAGRRASDDDEALWDHLAERALPSRPGFERDTSVLWLLGVAADGDPEAVSGRQQAAWLTTLGWRGVDGTDVQPGHVDEATRDVSHVVARVASRKGRRNVVDPVVARAFARSALLTRDD